MRVLILGAAGMLGHKLWQQLSVNHEVWVTVRKPLAYYRQLRLFDENRTIPGIDVSNTEALESAFRQSMPNVVVNCVGIIKQLKEANDPFLSLTINSLLPHRIARLCAIAGARLIHMSTDCVFSGSKGGYLETDKSDAYDLYGRTKYLGEVSESHCVTIRSSIIGRELETKSGLIEWFLGEAGKSVQGYRQAIYSGFTTQEMARIIETLITQHPSLSGLWHVSSEPISKYDLLCTAREAFGWRGDIIPNDSFKCDRSLDSSRFRARVNYRPPTWIEMLTELARQQ